MKREKTVITFKANFAGRAWVLSLDLRRAASPFGSIVR